jgi:cytochrome P450
MARISPKKDIVYRDKKSQKEYVIPAGIVYSMTTLISHTDPDVFEDPWEFRPQRWIDHPELDKAFIGFARGSRNCIG